MPSKNPAQRLRDIVDNIDAVAVWNLYRVCVSPPGERNSALRVAPLRTAAHQPRRPARAGRLLSCPLRHHTRTSLVAAKPGYMSACQPFASFTLTQFFRVRKATMANPTRQKPHVAGSGVGTIIKSALTPTRVSPLNRSVTFVYCT